MALLLTFITSNCSGIQAHLDHKVFNYKISEVIFPPKILFYDSAKININMVGGDNTLKICPLKEAISMFGEKN